MTETITAPRVGALVAYRRHAEAMSVEIGVVKRVTDRGAYVAYGSGDTCSLTPWAHLMGVDNAWVAPALVERMRQLGADVIGLSEGCEDWTGVGA